MKTRPTGFTLLELMIVITLAAIILGIAVPSFRDFNLNNRMTGAANDLLAAAHLARTESVKRHVQTVFCLSSAPNDAPACDGDGTQGWIVFVDDIDPDVAAATDNNAQWDAGEAILLRHGAIPDTIAVTSLPAGNGGYIAYNAAGFSRPVAAAGDDIQSLVLCDSRGNVATYGAANSTARAFAISSTGRPSVTRSVADINGLGGC